MAELKQGELPTFVVGSGGVAANCAVKFSDGKTVVLATDPDGDYTIGVAMDTVAEGGRVAVDVRIGIMIPMVAGEAITAPAILRCGTGGKVFIQDAADEFIIGIAGEDAAADTEVISVLRTFSAYVAAP